MFINVILTRSFYLYFVSECWEPPRPPRPGGGPQWPRRPVEAPRDSWRRSQFWEERERREKSIQSLTKHLHFILYCEPHTWLDQGSRARNPSPDSECNKVLWSPTSIYQGQVSRCRTWSRSAPNATSPSRTSSSWGWGTASSMNTVSGWCWESRMKIFSKIKCLLHS